MKKRIVVFTAGDDRSHESSLQKHIDTLDESSHVVAVETFSSSIEIAGSFKVSFATIITVEEKQ